LHRAPLEIQHCKSGTKSGHSIKRCVLNDPSISASNDSSDLNDSTLFLLEEVPRKLFHDCLCYLVPPCEPLVNVTCMAHRQTAERQLYEGCIKSRWGVSDEGSSLLLSSPLKPSSAARH
jgi:hypothetical protein